MLVVGLPKAGTSSLFEFFHCHGFHTQHWYCCGKQSRAQKGGPNYMSDCMIDNLQNELPILDGCGDYDVYTELNGPRRTKLGNTLMIDKSSIFLPQHYHLQELHDYSPASTWILNLRPVDEWIQSVVNTVNGNILMRQLVHEVLTHMPTTTTTTTHHPRGRNATRQFLRDFWYRHVSLVQEFVKDHPSHQLVMVNITDPHAGTQLANALGWKEVAAAHRAEACWGQHNVGTERERKDDSKPNHR
jgi:hypothetical protein